jgi:dCTP diphosphatase
MTKTSRVQKLQQALLLFSKERDWEKFHTPKNLAMALSVECSELVEIFQWMTAEQSYHPDAGTSVHIREEIGDIMIYLCMISSKLDIDPVEAAISKLAENENRYPSSEVRENQP